MLFRKKIERRCAYCAHGTALEENQILCAKKGLRGESDRCRKFRYDPCKRVPLKPKALDTSRYEQEDYSL